MDYNSLFNMALDAGFSETVSLDPTTITPHREVREVCERGTCGRYGKSWSCPPGCGTFEKCAERLKRHSHGLIVTTVGTLEDEFDGEGMTEAGKRHDMNMRALTAELRKFYPAFLAAGAGSCTVCEICTYPDEPCRDPNGPPVSMEALGMVVSEVCRMNNAVYNHGKNTITFVGCFLFQI